MYQPVNALNVYSIKNLHSALKAFSEYVQSVRVLRCREEQRWVFEWAPEGVGRGIQSGSGGPTDLSSVRPLDSGASHGCCDLQAALLELPLVMKSDCLIHGKQKCCQSSQTGHQRQQQHQPRDSSAQRLGPQRTGDGSGGGPLMWYWWWKDAWLLQYSC